MYGGTSRETCTKGSQESGLKIRIDGRTPRRYRNFYLFYSKDEFFHQVGGKLEAEKMQQLTEEIYPQVGGKIQLPENAYNEIRRQVGDEFHIHPIFSVHRHL